MGQFEDYLLKNHPILYIYQPLRAVLALFASLTMASIVLYLQSWYESAAKSLLSSFALLAICAVFGIYWMISLTFLDKPSNLRLYRRHRYYTLITFIFSIIAIGPYMLLPLQFESSVEQFPYLALTSTVTVMAAFISGNGPSNADDFVVGRFGAVALFIFFAVLRWFGTSWLVILSILIIIAVYVIFSFVMSLTIWKSRKSWHSMVTSMGFLVLMSSIIAFTLVAVTIGSQQFGLHFRQPVTLSNFGTEQLTMIIANIALMPAAALSILAVAIFEMGQIVFSYYAELPRE